MSRTFLVLILLATAIAAVLRLPLLRERPMHNDEAVNAIKFGKLWDRGEYKYDPNEHHGPTLYYATALLGKLTGAPAFNDYSETRLRLVTVLFGVGLLFLIPIVGEALGRSGTIWSLFFTAVSPAMVFYSRYYIHEMLLVFFTLMGIASAWRYWRSRKIRWLLLTGVAVGLMDGTKETFVITLASIALALVLNQTWNRLIDASGAPLKAPPLNLWHLGAAVFVWLVVVVLLFSSFFTNPSGPLDSIRSYLPWVQRAGGESPHIHPWHFYLHRLLWFHPPKSQVWTESMLFGLAVIGGIAGFRRRRLAGASPSFVRFLALYAFVLAGFYSFLPYKTPWCLLNFWQPLILLAGVGAAAIVDSFKAPAVRASIAVLIMVGVAHLSWQAWKLNTEYAADPRNPYVYAQTSPDTLDLVNVVDSIAKISPQNHQTLIQVVAPEDDYWPLPWYLRKFRNVGYWSTMPKDPYSPIMILSPRLPFTYDESRLHLMGFYGLRPQAPLSLFVDRELWQKWAEQQTRR